MSNEAQNLPKICVQWTVLDQIRHGWMALAQKNGKPDPDGHYPITPRLFLSEGRPARFDPGTERESVQAMTVDMLVYEAIHAARWYKIERTKDGSMKEVRTEPHEQRVIRKMLAIPESDIPLPVLEGFTTTPRFDKKGRLHAKPGYNQNTKTILRPGFSLKPVPPDPSAAEVQWARTLLIGEPCPELPEGGWLWDFQYTNRRADMAHALAAALQQYVRALIQGPTPLYLIDKPNAGDGASTLAHAIARIATASLIQPGSVDSGAGGDELRKVLTTEFRRGPEVVVFDNIGKALNSDVLAVALTADRWTDRILGSSNLLDQPIRCLWLGTGKNPTMNDQIKRRTIRIRLDPMGVKVQDRKYRRPGYDGLIGQPEVLRELVWAALVLCQNWVVRGMPAGPRRYNSYPAWARVMGGVLETAGVEGFLTLSQEQMHRHLDEGSEAMRAFVGAWWDRWKGNPVTAADLYQLHDEIDSEVELDLKKWQPKSAMRHVVDAAKDEHHGGFKIQRAGRINNTLAWRLTKMSGVDAEAMGEVIGGVQAAPEIAETQEAEEASEGI